MSDSDGPGASDHTVSTDADRATLAEAFGRNLDPLAEFAPTFDATAVDPFELFETDVLAARDLASRTREGIDRALRHWREHMAHEGRHPACPSEEHVKSFIRRERDEKGNNPKTVKLKLRRLNQAYEYWQDDPSFPHPQDYNPIKLARSKMNLDIPDLKEPLRIPVDELRDVLADVMHVRERGIIATQLKLGLRASELCNIKLADVDIQNAELREYHPEMGTNPMLDGHENAVYIPHDRERNKSTRPRLLPLDDELRRVLLRYLLIRPDAGEPWVYLSQTSRTQLNKKTINEVWKTAFHPLYAETDNRRGVTSHYGRHRFTTWWRVENDTNRELVKYMRGDAAKGRDPDGRNAMQDYIHTYYEDIEPLYRENIYRLGL